MQLTVTSPFVAAENLIYSHISVKLILIYLHFEADVQWTFNHDLSLWVPFAAFVFYVQPELYHVPAWRTLFVCRHWNITFLLNIGEVDEFKKRRVPINKCSSSSQDNEASFPALTTAPKIYPFFSQIPWVVTLCCSLPSLFWALSHDFGFGWLRGNICWE